MYGDSTHSEPVGESVPVVRSCAVLVKPPQHRLLTVPTSVSCSWDSPSHREWVRRAEHREWVRRAEPREWVRRAEPLV